MAVFRKRERKNVSHSRASIRLHIITVYTGRVEHVEPRPLRLNHVIGCIAAAPPKLYHCTRQLLAVLEFTH